jgi:UDP-N-acetylenolpyruvoylglucosamine reductase
MSTIEQDIKSTYHEDSTAAADIEALIHLVHTKVQVQTKIDLVYEVHIIGDC